MLVLGSNEYREYIVLFEKVMHAKLMKYKIGYLKPLSRGTSEMLLQKLIQVDLVGLILQPNVIKCYYLLLLLEKMKNCFDPRYILLYDPFGTLSRVSD